MKHLIALALKYVLLATVFFAIVPLFLRVSSAELLWFSLWMTIVAYALGDLYLLPRFGNLSAAIADFGLAFVGVWIGIGAFYDGNGTAVLNAAFFSALLVALGEVLFHAYVQRFILRGQEEEGVPLLGREWQTEMAEEFDVRREADHDDQKQKS
ncbi:YndM family protein [Parageobacillus sp. VR-IP]|uniref:YndM family protein n=1 Tax=Parageobacillus sp. VR-IP TaxID=2742205 RepID=UPI001583E6CA|nr:YndM family protein [Parageobacillus sp. VR-IP]NUK29412.1 YndM family protein [Parageobacillus sp. VR-IP]